MNTRIFKFTVLVLAFSLGPFAANATDPVEFEGHHYEVVSSGNIDWEDARDLAELKIFAGVNGHLATITSVEEDDFVDGLRDGLGFGQVWIGGFQDLPCTSEPKCGWTWVNEEGTFPGTNGGSGFGNDYSNWTSGEPNNSGGSEDHLTLGLSGLALRGV